MSDDITSHLSNCEDLPVIIDDMSKFSFCCNRIVVVAIQNLVRFISVSCMNLCCVFYLFLNKSKEVANNFQSI